MLWLMTSPALSASASCAGSTNVPSTWPERIALSRVIGSPLIE